MKSLEEQLAEKDRELQELRRPGGKNAGKLVVQLSESGLPVAAQTRLAKRFESATNLDGLPKAIKEEHEYIRQVRKATARNNSGSTSEGDARLFESYKSLGLSDNEASIAAGVEKNIANIQESRKKLADAAKLLGLSDSEADAFSDM